MDIPVFDQLNAQHDAALLAAERERLAKLLDAEEERCRNDTQEGFKTRTVAAHAFAVAARIIRGEV